MALRLVNTPPSAYETDLPDHVRNIHPSGVLHAFRSTKTGISYKEEHAFAWIADSVHIEYAMHRLERVGFDRENGIVFIPYSSKKNWLERYPHTLLSLECTDRGKVFVDLGQHQDDYGSAGAVAAAAATADVDTDEAVLIDDADACRYTRNSLSRDERDELHIQIHNYFSWMHERVLDLQKKAAAREEHYASNDDDGIESEAMDDASKDDDGMESSEAMDNDEMEYDAVHQKEKNYAERQGFCKDVNATKLQDVLEKLEVVFPFLPKSKSNEAAVEIPEQQSADTTQTLLKEPPFLEKSLGKALNKYVVARKLAESQKRPTLIDQGRRQDFDEAFQKLVQYKEKHGHCIVKVHDKENPEVSVFVHNLRKKRRILDKRGVEYEEFPPEKWLSSKALTVERIERLNSIGFVWAIRPPKLSWDDRFREMMQYYETNGKWPTRNKSNNTAGLGMWVQWQRNCYSRKEANFMKDRFLKMDEVGFDWDPQATKREESRRRKAAKEEARKEAGIETTPKRKLEIIAFDEMFDKLVQFKEEHGHCRATFKNTENRQVPRFVNCIRMKRKYLRKQGMEYEERPPNFKIRNKTLTAERIELLDSIGFEWTIKPPRVPWEVWFQELLEFHKTNGKWPTQSAGPLGMWVQRQRVSWSRKDKSFMKDKFPKLDAVGFVWDGMTTLPWACGSKDSELHSPEE